MIFVVLNAVAYLFSLLMYQRKKKDIDVGTFIYALFALSSIGSVWYYSHDNMDIYYPNITFLPFLYLWIMINICIFPMSKLNFKKLRSIDDRGVEAFLNLFSIFLVVFSVLPFLALISKFSIYDLVGDSLGEMYEANIDKAGYYFSGISKISYSLIRRFGDIAIVLLFYQLTKKRRKKWLVLGLLLSNAFFFLFSLVSGSRGGMLATLFVIVAMGLLLKNVFEASLFLKLKKIAILVTIIIGLMVILISVSRFNYSIAESSSTATLDRWISQYIGEGMIRFNNDLWYIDRTMKGSQNFYYIKSLIGNGDIGLYQSEMTKFEGLLGLPVNVFYTFIGDFYLDFGLIGTFFLVLCFSVFYSRLLCCSSGRISISQLILLAICFHMLSFGFAANLYRTVYIQRDTMFLFLVAIILYIIQQVNKFIGHKVEASEKHVKMEAI